MRIRNTHNYFVKTIGWKGMALHDIGEDGSGVKSNGVRECALTQNLRTLIFRNLAGDGNVGRETTWIVKHGHVKE